MDGRHLEGGTDVLNFELRSDLCQEAVSKAVDEDSCKLVEMRS